MHRFAETATAENVAGTAGTAGTVAENVAGVAGTLHDRLPEMIDQALGRLHEIGIERILKLAEAMVEQRLSQPANAHLTSTAGRN